MAKISGRETDCVSPPMNALMDIVQGKLKTSHHFDKYCTTCTARRIGPRNPAPEDLRRN